MYRDTALFGLLFILQPGLFFVFHIFALRTFRNRNLLYCAAASALAATGAVTLAGYFFLSEMFSSPGAWAVSLAGSALASLFACGLYTFLGPATADRSLACQMLVALRESPGGKGTRDGLFRGFNPDGFIEKRIGECREESLLTGAGGELVLTEKGRKLADKYIFLLGLLGLKERAGYVQYFTTDGNKDRK
ncbi:MAG TPA: hypothetical protein PKC29_04985 [Thermodesulfobacteriota bacterium]|nr:hypothetical protein [Thermodesulfobacteriota bacterium]